MELSFGSFLYLLFLAFLCPVLLFFFNRRSPTSPANGDVALKSYPLLGTLPHLIKNGRRLLDWSAELILASPTATVTVAPIIFTGNPSNVEHLAKAKFDNYPKDGLFMSPVGDLLGHGILNVNGEEWRFQRKAASAFGTRSLRAFVLDKVQRQLAGRLFPLLIKASQSGDILDLQSVLERFAFDTICSLVLGEDPKCLGGGSEEGERFFRAFGEATFLSLERAMQPLPLVWKAKRWLDIGSERRLRESMAIVRGFIDRCVRSRREKRSVDDEGSGTDFVSWFEQDGTNSDEIIGDILINFVIAGRDTTPAALTWFFWILSSHPRVVNNIREEIKRIRSRRAQEDDDGEGAAFKLEELREMNYLHAAISESLRLYPSVPLVPKYCEEEDELPDGSVVRKGWIVMYNAYAMGRREEIWGADCREFKPERWLEEGVFQPKSTSMFPAFHGGPRMCLGKEVAYVQMKALAAGILERLEIEVVEGSGRHQVLMTMRMEGGLQVRVKERDGHYAPGK